MKKIEISASLIFYDDYRELKNQDLIKLCDSAFNSLNHAYAPYSDYHVGSAVLLDNGAIVEGSNQENAVFPLGLCAERVAIFSSLTSHPETPIAAIAIVTKKEVSNSEHPGFPCGSCRQVISEMEDRFNRNITIVVLAPDMRAYVIKSAKDLLPFAFSTEDVSR